MAQYGSIDSPRMRETGRPVHAKGRMFVVGDSFSSIRRTDPSNNVNGRLSASSGMILWDWFRIGFNPVLQMDTTTNYAREGAFALRTIANPPAPIPAPLPGGQDQWNSLKAANPANTITRHDVFGLLIGINDSNAWDGGAPAAVTQIRDFCQSILLDAIAHGFTRLMWVIPEARFYPTLWDLSTPVVEAIRASNRELIMARCSIDSAANEFSQAGAYIDGAHLSDECHRRLGEVMSSAFWNYSIVDRTKSLYISNRVTPGAAAIPKAIGFSNFDATATIGGSTSRFELQGASTSFEVKQSQRPRLRGFNGIDVFGAWEGVEPTSPVGGGKNDPCVRIVGGGLTHDSILRLEALAGGTADQSPLLIGQQGTTDRVKIKANGEAIFSSSHWAPATIKSAGVGIARIVIDSDLGGNCGFSFKSSGVDTWAVAAYRTGVGAGLHHLAFFNYGTNPATLPFGCHGTTNRTIFGGISWDAIDTPSGRVEIQEWTGDPGVPYLRCITSTKALRAEILSNGTFNIAGAYQVNSTQVLGSRITGWTQSATGGNRSNITTGSTTAQVAAALIQLITDLKTHGLISA